MQFNTIPKDVYGEDSAEMDAFEDVITFLEDELIWFFSFNYYIPIDYYSIFYLLLTFDFKN